jgi:iron complex transport system ATP-binding protein
MNPPGRSQGLIPERFEREGTPMSFLVDLEQAVTRVPGRRFGPFSMRVRCGERIAILGPSGAGKSTLLKLLAAERAVVEGQALFDGSPLQASSAARLAERRAVLPQAHGVAFGMPVNLVVALGRFARGAHSLDVQGPRIVAKALALAEAAHLSGRRFDTLSGGEQARVQIARVMAQLWDVQDGLLLVDEPLAALDPGLQLELLDALTRFTQERGHALIAIVHDINQALAGFERLWLLREGALVADLCADRAAVPVLADLFGIRLTCLSGDDGALAVLAQRAPRGATEAAAALA